MTYYTLGSNKVEIRTMIYVLGFHLWTSRKTYYQEEETKVEADFPTGDKQSKYLEII